jgi:hypothetical protein
VRSMLPKEAGTELLLVFWAQGTRRVELVTRREVARRERDQGRVLIGGQLSDGELRRGAGERAVHEKVVPVRDAGCDGGREAGSIDDVSVALHEAAPLSCRGQPIRRAMETHDYEPWRAALRL